MLKCLVTTENKTTALNAIKKRPSLSRKPADTLPMGELDCVRPPPVYPRVAALTLRSRRCLITSFAAFGRDRGVEPHHRHPRRHATRLHYLPVALTMRIQY